MLFAFATSCVFFGFLCLFLCVCAGDAGENANELTLPEQGDRIFDSSDYNIFRSISSFSIVIFLFDVQFDVFCFQLI